MSIEELIVKAKESSVTQPELAINMGRKIIREGRKIKDMKTVASGHYVIAFSMFSLGRRGDILQHALQAASIFEGMEDYAMQSRSQNLLGIAYAAMDEHQLALAAYLTAYRIAEEHKLRGIRDTILNNIASQYYTLGDAKTAVKYLSRLYARITKQKKTNYNLLNAVAYNLCDIYEHLQDYDKAQEFAKVCGELHSKTETLMESLMYYTRVTKLNYVCGNIEKANEYADQLIECLRNGEESYELLDDMEYIALKQIEIGEEDRADVIADYLWDYSEKTNFTSDIIRACRVQGTYFDKQKDYEQAMRYYRVMDENVRIREKQVYENQLTIIKNLEDSKKQMAVYRHEMIQHEIENQKDALTGLLNRSMLTVIMETYMQRAKEQGNTLGCIFMDVDYFKEYNDTYGHLKGDDCLRKIGRICLDVEEKNKHIHFIRYGGDEIFCMTSGYTDQELLDVAKEVSENLKKERILHEHPNAKGYVSLSIGVVNINLEKDSDVLEVMNYSDRALYHSKGMGRGRISVFDSIAHRRGDKDEEKYLEIVV